MNKFYMNGKLIHKASDHNTKRCEVEKWVFLPHSDFERLKANPYQEHEAITAARDLMYEDKNAYHFIMLLDEYGEDGLLIIYRIYRILCHFLYICPECHICCYIIGNLNNIRCLISDTLQIG